MTERIGRYRVLGELGTGGMGCLYLARAEGPGGFERLLAIKMLLPHLCKNRTFVEMFLDEARITAMIQHPNVVQTFEVGEHDGQYFIAMDYVSGETLATLLTHTWKAGRPFPRDLATYVVACAADGLHAAHELRDLEGRPKGVVHRDVSPQNLLIGYDGQIRVVDFGIAKAADRLSHTGTGVRKGKAAYMSPEQVRTEAVDRRADVFALGVVLWEATVGKRLFKAHNDFATIDRVMRKVVPSPRRFHRDYPEELERIVLRALQRDVERRYQTALEMADDLRAYLAGRSSLIGPAALAGLMDAVFPERKQARAELIRKAALEQPPPLEPIRDEETSASLSRARSEDEDFLDPVPEIGESTAVEAPVAAFQSGEIRARTRVDPIAAIGVTFGLLGLALALSVVLWFGRAEPEAEALAPPPAAPPAALAPAPAPVEDEEEIDDDEEEPAPTKRTKRRLRKRIRKAERSLEAEPKGTDLFGADEL